MVPACPYTEVPLYIIIISSDETCSWAEVYAEDQSRYVCLHIPSSSVDQPKRCEKQCPHKLSYVLAFESSESSISPSFDFLRQNVSCVNLRETVALF